MNESDNSEIITPSVGRGRGRGAGVPLLPTGVWDELNRKEEIQEPSLIPQSFTTQKHHSKAKDNHGISNKNTKKFEKNGTEWECPSCTNINWHWRSTCNKCNGAKPASLFAVSIAVHLRFVHTSRLT